jgi:hypothetical protein
MTGPAPKQESNVAALVTMVAIAAWVDPPLPPPTESPAPAATKVEEGIEETRQDSIEGPD